MAVLRGVGKAAGGAVPVAQLARLGLPALVTGGVLAVLVLGAVCWILTSDARAGRLARVLGAWRGTAVIPETSAAVFPAARRGRRWPRGGTGGRRGGGRDQVPVWDGADAPRGRTSIPGGPSSDMVELTRWAASRARAS